MGRSTTARVAVEDPSELLRRCRAGDQDAWATLVTRYERLVFSVPRTQGLDRDAAADVMQSTFVELLDNLDTLRDGRALGAWLATVARRQTWRLIERERRQREVDQAAHDAFPSDAVWHDVMDAWNRRNWVVEAVLALRAPCRDLLAALYLDPSSPSYDEVAERLGRPRGAIGPTRGRCLDKLRVQLRRLDDDR